MNVLFRVDSSDKIGSGHVMRCMTLANELRRKQSDVSFICRELPGNLIELIKDQGLRVHLLKHNKKHSEIINEKNLSNYSAWLDVDWLHDANQCLSIVNALNIKPDWLIVDHYSLDKKWEDIMKGYVKRIMVIDDLADRPHICDILLDQNLKETPERYKQLVPDNCTMLLGPQYALLRPEFIEARKKVKVRDGKIDNILVFFGGTDLSNETEKTINAIKKTFPINFSVTAIVGKNNPYKSHIEALCKQSSHLRYFCQVDNMADLMAHSDLAIGAGGTTAWERCAMGLPSLLISVADNQDLVCTYLERVGAAVFLGKKEVISADYLRRKLIELLGDIKKINKMSSQAYTLVDTLGTNRVLDKIYAKPAIN